MTAFLAAAIAVTAAACLVLILLARLAAGGSGGPDPAVLVHRRALAELGELSDRGLLGPADEKAARAEAARRLLASAAGAAPQERAGARGSRRAVVLTALACAAAAFALYFKLGAPADPDQPYAARVAMWRRADPSGLDPPKLAAVLRQVTKERPNDPRGFEFLGRMQAASGDPYLAARSFAAAGRLDPANPQYPLLEGEALLDLAGGRPAPEAEAALRRSLAIDPKNLAARFSLGRAEIDGGERGAGLDLWRGILAELPSSDPRKAPFEKEVERVAAGGRAAPAPAGGGPQTAGEGLPPEAMGFIRAMVASLKDRLAKAPDDPAGWARLVRSMGVLHDRAGQAEALEGARRAFAGAPDKLAPALAEARAHPA
jgi:cytochrome c-type biogenesis protein CcmH